MLEDRAKLGRRVDAGHRDVVKIHSRRGLFVEAQAGALALAGDANKVSKAGPRFAVALGYELLPWLSPLLVLEASIHGTDNRPPPAASAYELLGAAAGVRFSIPFDARAALWLDGLVGMNWASGDVLRSMGFADAFKLGFNYGGELGNGTFTHSVPPVRVDSRETFSVVSAGGPTCAVARAGSAWCWGSNPWGAVGQEPSDP